MRAPSQIVNRPLAHLLLLSFVFLAPPVRGQDATDSAVERLAALLEKREGKNFWRTVGKLEALGEGAAPRLQSLLERPNERTRLGCAKALLGVGDPVAQKKALETLARLAESAQDTGVQVDAIQIYGLSGHLDEEDLDEALEVLQGVFEEAVDPELIIPLARTLWEMDHVTEARDRLVDLLKSRSADVRHEAALTLAELGYFEGEVRTILRTLKAEPTPRGRRAALLDQVMRLSRQLDGGLRSGDLVLEGTDLKKLLKSKETRIRELEDTVERISSRSGGGAGPQTAADRLLAEVISKIKKFYVDKERTVRKDLLLSAIKGMVRALDQHSSFMDPDETRRFRQELHGEYPGIGAQVSKPHGAALEIVRPIYGGPAFQKGIRSGDRIVEIDGVRTPDLSLDEIMKLLKGPQGTTVSLKIFRRGWTETKDFEITRQIIEVPSVYYEQLPEKIGYIGLTQFGRKSGDEFVEALEALEKEGLAGLIIGLRDNGGGFLDVAVKMVDLFVQGDMPIVTQKGQPGSGEAEIPHYPTPSARSAYPIVVLVNQNSASASEVVAGALQDFGRASLVGKRTFGKGSVQSPIPLKNLEGSQLKLTVKYYYLPLGRCIHTRRDLKGRILEKGGVDPDVVVDQPSLAGWRLEARTALRDRSEVIDYVDRHFDALVPLIPLGDLGDTSRLPQLDELRAALETPGNREDVRAAVLYHVRRRLEDRRGRPFAFDLQGDRQLQVALLELIRLMGRDAQDLDAYRWIPPQQPPPKPEQNADAENK